MASFLCLITPPAEYVSVENESFTERGVGRFFAVVELVVRIAALLAVIVAG